MHWLRLTDRSCKRRFYPAGMYTVTYGCTYMDPREGAGGGGEEGESHVKKKAGDVNRDIRQTNQVFHKLIILNAIIMNLRDDLDT